MKILKTKLFTSVVLEWSKEANKYVMQLMEPFKKTYFLGAH